MKANWRWAALNMFALAAVCYTLIRGNINVDARWYTFDPALESGKWAIRFLLFSLTMSPLNSYFGWRSAIKLRKPVGLWAFGFASLHFLLLYTDNQFGGGFHWLEFPIQFFIVLGLTGLVILSAMALTSNRWAMKGLGKRWKQLHRLVYLVGIVVIYHAILAIDNSKRVFIRDPFVIYELHIYLVILTVLLLIRIPLLRNQLKCLMTHTRGTSRLPMTE